MSSLTTRFQRLLEELRNETYHTSLDQDQQRIAETCLLLTTFLLEKNHKYRSSFKEGHPYNSSLSPKDCIDLRIADKLKRLTHLSGGGLPSADESEHDTTLDLAGYFLLRYILLGAPPTNGIQDELPSQLQTPPPTPGDDSPPEPRLKSLREGESLPITCLPLRVLPKDLLLMLFPHSTTVVAARRAHTNNIPCLPPKHRDCIQLLGLGYSGPYDGWTVFKEATGVRIELHPYK